VGHDRAFGSAIQLRRLFSPRLHKVSEEPYQCRERELLEWWDAQLNRDWTHPDATDEARDIDERE
jgi:hypothetical protein